MAGGGIPYASRVCPFPTVPAMSEPTSFGGHGLRGRTLFLGFWAAMSLPHVLGLLDTGPVHAAVGAAVALAAGWGLARVAYRTDESIGCLFAVAAGAGMGLSWWMVTALGDAPSHVVHLASLVGAAFLPALLVLGRAVVVRRQERAGGE